MPGLAPDRPDAVRQRQQSLDLRPVGRRDVGERVQAIAPFLSFDSPYITVVDGHLYWIVDGYTSASSYPLT